MQGRVLLLQGPMGPFFRWLAQELKAEGHEVFKINFNAGDEAFYRLPGAYAYRGDLASWPAYLEDFLKQHRIDRIFLFGDCRPLHLAAVEVAKRLGVAVFVFEEGYLRPHYITLEPGGVNAYSTLPRDPMFYREYQSAKPDNPTPVGRVFRYVAWYATWYAIISWLGRWRFPHYEHHRPLNPFVEAGRWIRSGWLKLVHRVLDKRITRQLVGPQARPFFLVPLQVHCDAQITHHSPYESMEPFIREVIASFAKHAPADTWLVLKHHPLDRPYTDFGPLIKELVREHKLEGRVHYVHEAYLPALLGHARGTVTVNSTVGLSSIHHNTPVKILGDAVYDIPGLASTRSLDTFWRRPGKVNRELYMAFRHYLVRHVLGNGNFYRRVCKNKGPTGVAWPFGSISAASDPARYRATVGAPIVISGSAPPVSAVAAGMPAAAIAIGADGNV